MPKAFSEPTQQHRDEARKLLEFVCENFNRSDDSCFDAIARALSHRDTRLLAEGRAEGLREAAFIAREHANGAGHMTGNGEAICIAEHLEEVARHGIARTAGATTLIERVAKELQDHAEGRTWKNLTDDDRDAYRTLAGVAVGSIRAYASASGWQGGKVPETLPDSRALPPVGTGSEYERGLRRAAEIAKSVAKRWDVARASDFQNGAHCGALEVSETIRAELPTDAPQEGKP